GLHRLALLAQRPEEIDLPGRLEVGVEVLGDAADRDQRRRRAAERLGDLAARAAGDVAGGIGLPDAALLGRAGLAQPGDLGLDVRARRQRLGFQLVELDVAEDRP